MRGSSLAIAISSISFLLTVIWGSPFIRLLRQLNIGKIIRMDVPESHMAKMNTPTMGGFMFLIPITLLTVILNAVSLLDRILHPGAIGCHVGICTDWCGR